MASRGSLARQKHRQLKATPTKHESKASPRNNKISKFSQTLQYDHILTIFQPALDIIFEYIELIYIFNQNFK